VQLVEFRAANRDDARLATSNLHSTGSVRAIEAGDLKNHRSLETPR